jgi:ribosomal protein L23
LHPPIGGVNPTSPHSGALQVYYKAVFESSGSATEYNVDKAILELCGIKVEKVEWFKVRGNNFEVPKEIRGEIENKLSK